MVTEQIVDLNGYEYQREHPKGAPKCDCGAVKWKGEDGRLLHRAACASIEGLADELDTEDGS